MSQRGMVQKIPTVRTQLIPPMGAKEAGFTHDRKPLWRLERVMNRPVPDIESEASVECGTDERGLPVHTWKNDNLDHPVCEICDTVGTRLYKTHSQTNEKIVAIRRRRNVLEARIFYLEDGGNCHVNMVDYVPPTKEELEAEERKGKVKRMEGVLAGVLVDGGWDDKTLKATLAAGPAPLRGVIPPDQPETVVTTSDTFDDSSPEFNMTTTNADAPSTPTVPPVMEAVKYPAKDEKGPWWTLSDGTRLRGEAAAQAAEDALQAERVVGY